ncbi:MAG: nucleotidyltransferase family protein [Lachnospiraceae bacterium]|nr:nucleotidyltransferase family protein [Lachnospiraceae bacterium]
MRTVGIIAEYNPFHTGHEYHLRKAKELSDADFAVVVMSPDYVQRGAPAIFDKYIRTEMALRCGADLVIELPVCYATGSAEYFAEGAVRLLDGLGVVDTLCFGAEPGEASGSAEVSAAMDCGSFQTVAEILLEEPEPYRLALREGLRLGLPFPRAREEALNRYIGVCGKEIRHTKDSSDEAKKDRNTLSALLSTPNSILGVEYCKALKKIHSRICPLPLPRRGSSYSEQALTGEYCSAGAIRECLEKGDVHSLDGYIPDRIRALFAEAGTCPIFPDDLLPLLTYRLIDGDNLDAVFDLSGDLAERVHRLRFQCIGKRFREITALLKTKQITEARIRRALLHLILDIRKETVASFCREGYVFYAHILGFRREAAPLLHEIRQKSALPLISRAASAGKQLSDPGRQMWSMDVAASHLYRAIRAEKYGIPFRTEQEISPVRL